MIQMVSFGVLMMVLYNILLHLAALAAVPYYGMIMLLTGKYRSSLAGNWLGATA